VDNLPTVGSPGWEEAENSLIESLQICLNKRHGDFDCCSGWDGKERPERTVWNRAVALTLRVAQLEGATRTIMQAFVEASAAERQASAEVIKLERRVAELEKELERK